MKKLEAEIRLLTHYAEGMPEFAELFKHQAYGAAMYHLALFPEDEVAVMGMWEVAKVLFDSLIRSVAEREE